MDVPNPEVCVKTEEQPEEYMLPTVKKEEVSDDSSAETKMDFEYIHVKMEHGPERLMGSSPKNPTELQQKFVDPEAGCSFWKEQTDVNHSRDVPEEDNLTSHSPLVKNEPESRIYCDELGKVCETWTSFSNQSSPNEDVPPEFEKVFVYDVHVDKDFSASDQEPDEQITSNKHLRIGQEPQPGCSSWSDELELPHERGLDSTSVNRKGGSYQHEDCSGEGNVQANRKEVTQAIQQTNQDEPTNNPTNNIHLRTHTDEKPFQCTNCIKSFSRQFHLDNHLRSHSGDGPFPCTICSKRFSQKSHLIYHMSTHTGEKPFTCTVCTKRFSRKSSLNTHMRIHTGEKPFECMICSAKFSRTFSLNIHVRTHTGDKPFQCEICSKRFTDNSHLNDHIRTHTREKPYLCTICNKRFRQKSYLGTHMRIHSGDRPFQCVICSKRFSASCYRNEHIRTHTGEKPFQCIICAKMFSQKSHLNIHIRTHNK